MDFFGGQAMNKSTKYILVFSLLIVVITVIFLGEYKQKNDQNRLVKTALDYEAKQKKIDASNLKFEKEILSDIPGFITWGDSLTAGAGGNGVSYPSVLQDLISTKVYELPVVNMGVGGENTDTIMGRAGSVPFVTNEFTIPNGTSKTLIDLRSQNGDNVAPLRQGDGGINPVTISGVKGTISINQSSVTSSNFNYYFTRSVEGKSVKVKDESPIKTDSLYKYKNYVPIIFMGQNGGFNTNQELINQINSILKMNKSNKKFLVLGLTTGDSISRSALETAMKEEFGSRYLNLREYVSKNGLSIAGIKPSQKDLTAMKIGAMPPSLLSDKVHFNEYGYRVVGHAVFERLNKLGYFNNISKLVKRIQ